MTPRSRNSRGGIGLLVPLVVCAPLVLSCQRLDSNLATGVLGVGVGVDGGVPPVEGAVTCSTLRSDVFHILSTNCSICHQAPGTPSLYMGSFNFILDLGQLTSQISPQSSTTLTLKYVVKGHPEQSFIYQRMSNNSMPPAFRTQRPSAGDIATVGHWITNCIDDPTSPSGWGGDTGADGGGDGGGASTLSACGPANVCPDGGCCVFSQCRPNGTTCGPLPNPIAGQPDLPGLSGTCNMGSCTTQAGMSCGSVNETCCDLMTCTASQSSCLINTTVCSACGGTGQPCCKPNGCLAGRQCVNGGVGRIGTCEVCGDIGQPCCGSGVAAQETCNGTLTCVSVSGMGNICSADGGTPGSGTDGGGGS